jgi:L-threonylcarbamoyladenylate synthase
MLPQGCIVPLYQLLASGAAEPNAASPGLLTRHCSPRAELRPYDGPEEAVIAAMREAVRDWPSGARPAVLALSEDLPRLADLPALLVDLGSRSHLEEVAQSLYAELRRLDEEGIPGAVLRLVPPGGLGDAINDRLRRAASGRVIRVPTPPPAAPPGSKADR